MEDAGRCPFHCERVVLHKQLKAALERVGRLERIRRSLRRQLVAEVRKNECREDD